MKANWQLIAISFIVLVASIISSMIVHSMFRIGVFYSLLAVIGAFIVISIGYIAYGVYRFLQLGGK